MKKILISSTNQIVNETAKVVCRKFSNYFDPLFCPDTEEALSFIDYELPEIKVLDFSSKDIDCHRVLVGITSDPWLHNGGIIAVVEDSTKIREIEDEKNPNILIVLTVSQFEVQFERILRILKNNNKFLFNRGMLEFVSGEEKGSFVCENDFLEMRLYIGFLVNYLYCSNRITEETRYAVQTTLMELMTNALEHGNCNISYEEKAEWLNSGKLILDLINEKLKDPEIAVKKIILKYEISKSKSVFTIRDEGKGFDWRAAMENYSPNGTEASGRGMALSKQLVSDLRYNEKGNEVSFEVVNSKDLTNNVPGIMIPFATITYKKHEIVCRQNEPSTDLYFIVSGRYGVYADGKLISVLTPNDIFIGEMAFLLDDYRTATIMSAGEGKLIRIPKVSFLNLIRKNPHYGIFLSKLLAQRVLEQRKRTVELQNEVDKLKSKIF